MLVHQSQNRRRSEESSKLIVSAGRRLPASQARLHMDCLQARRGFIHMDSDYICETSFYGKRLSASQARLHMDSDYICEASFYGRRLSESQARLHMDSDYVCETRFYGRGLSESQASEAHSNYDYVSDAETFETLVVLRTPASSRLTSLDLR